MLSYEFQHEFSSSSDIVMNIPGWNTHMQHVLVSGEHLSTLGDWYCSPDLVISKLAVSVNARDHIADQKVLQREKPFTLSAGSDTSPSSSSKLLYRIRCLFTDPSSGASVPSIMMSSVLLKVDRVSFEGRPHAHCMTSCLLLASAKGPCTYFCQSGLRCRALRMSALRLLASIRLQQPPNSQSGHILCW